ncbi:MULTISPECIES: hypothetical protein [Subtercola]|uniref:GAF domain-containing protein n=1 Tax=Subtercola vilae TaxID=2056433 RepID=A0A4V4RFA3_9MICO|nr:MULTISPECIES: hypothetical protein [Subtercola]MEA9986058.1 hypothetical protein [Subtercola sp. RTI3]TIH36924.1 hypothetical protein D4765_09310 [Subtercola vilae]
MTGPEVHEENVRVELSAAAERMLAGVCGAAIRSLGATLVTVSLWRPEQHDLVRIASNLPAVYRVGGISSGLGADWVRQCVIDQVSFIAEDEAAVTSDAFEHHDVLAALNLGAAINAVIARNGVFYGCLNVLGPAGSFTEAQLIEADALAARLIDTLAGL